MALGSEAKASGNSYRNDDRCFASSATRQHDSDDGKNARRGQECTVLILNAASLTLRCLAAVIVILFYVCVNVLRYAL